MGKNRTKREKLAVARMVARAERKGVNVPDDVLDDMRWSKVEKKTMP